MQKVKSSLNQLFKLIWSFPIQQEQLFLVLLTIFTAVAFITNFLVDLGEQQFMLLSRSFLHGKLNLLELPQLKNDLIYYSGKFYWPLGPLPSVLLLPFSFVFEKVNIIANQGYFHFMLNTLIFYVTYKIAKKFGYSKEDSKFMAFAFVFASVYQSIIFISWSWFFAQSLATLCFLLAFWEYLNKKRFILIGLLMAFVFMSRFTAGLGVIFFITLILSEKAHLNIRIKELLKLCTPILIAGILLFAYNYLRFADFFETGYGLVNSHSFNGKEVYGELSRFGLFNLKYLPTNIYYYFLKTFDVVRYDFSSAFEITHLLKFPYIDIKFPGTSFFVVSPVFLNIFRTNKKNKYVRHALLPTVLIIVLLLCYFWSGWRQVGPRYTIDVLAFLYIFLLFSFKRKRLGSRVKTLILVSSIFNFIFFLMAFNS